MVIVAKMVKAVDCDSTMYGFKSRQLPSINFYFNFMIHPQTSHLRILRSLKVKYLKGFTTKIIDKFKKKKIDRKKSSIYKIYLREKKKIRYFYCITEKQLINYIKQASKIKGFITIILFQLLEMRLDTIIFRFGLTPTIVSARQFISHGHILVNSKKVTIPSFLCNINDIIEISNKEGYSIIFNVFKKTSKFSSEKKTNFSHLKFDKKNNKGIIVGFPQKIDDYTFLNFSYIVNNYKRYRKLNKVCYRK